MPLHSDEGIDVKSMGRIFIGLVQCGAWGCFDEFNRLEEAVLSAVSMQIQLIQAALRAKAEDVELLGRHVPVNAHSGIFITLNPAGKGYGGRQKLPDNLKQLFRPVAMSRPDLELIAEVILYSEGYQNGRDLGRKVVALYAMAKELLTSQQHYDWGLRALKTILRAAGSLLQSHRAEHNAQGALSDSTEALLLVQAIRVNTLSKLTAGDSRRFEALVHDTFSGVQLADIQRPELVEAVRSACHDMKLVS